MEKKDLIEKLGAKETLFWKYEDDDNSIMLSAWRDKKVCYHITTAVDNELFESEPSQKAKRREKRFNTYTRKLEKETGNLNELISIQEKKAIVIEAFSSADEEEKAPITNSIQNQGQETYIPKIITEYSQFMKGVDLFNQSASYYSFPHRSVKWYRPIVIWLLEVALNNSYRLYKQSFGVDALDSLKFRMQIIQEWQREYLDDSAYSSNDEGPNEDDGDDENNDEDTNMDIEEESQDMEEEDECRLGSVHDALDCNICSDRTTARRRTKYVCLNPNCMVNPRRSDQQPHLFRVHPECFHLHLRNN